MFALRHCSVFEIPGDNQQLLATGIYSVQMCMQDCVCVCVKERDRQTDRQTETDRQSGRQRQTETDM